MSKTQLARTTASIRPGEGAAQVEVNFVPRSNVSDKGKVAAQINLATVPVPHRRYSADVAAVNYWKETVQLLFAQKKLSGDDLRSLVIVKMNADWAKRFLDSIADAEVPFDKYATTNNIANDAMVVVEEEPKDTVAFDANFTLAAISGRQACLDFYYSSPFAFSASQGAKKLAVDPVLRVDLRAGLLMGVIDGIRKIVDEMGDEILMEEGHE
jgi:hypothetical protein